MSGEPHDAFNRITCSECGGDTRVMDTEAVSTSLTRRHRRCIDCGHRLTTYEHVVHVRQSVAVARLKKRAALLRDMAAQLDRMADEIAGNEPSNEE